MATIITILQRLASPPKQTLRTLQPTPSTVSYTVSTRPVPKTLPAILGFYIGIPVRILIGIGTLVVLWTKWRVSTTKSTGLLLWMFGNAGKEQLVKVADMSQWRYLAPGALLVLYLVFHRGYTGKHPFLRPAVRFTPPN